jgi:L-ascorbate metabolism protein UlaG (beta-lactamase superfamily)
MKKILILLQILSATGLFAQRITADKVQAGKDSLIIQPLTHASLVLEWNKKVIYIDPTGGSKAYEGLPAPDIILITDIHGDHCDTTTLKAIQTKSTTNFIMPYEVSKLIPKGLAKNATVLGNGKETTVSGVPIRAVPMYNLPETADSRHPKGRGNGYVVSLGNKKIYISGDTEDIPEMRALKNIDIAFVCMNLPYTMDINQAASAVLEFKPKIVYPYHYRGKEGFSDVDAFKKLVTEKNKEIEVRLRDWYSG